MATTFIYSQKEKKVQPLLTTKDKVGILSSKNTR